MNANINSPMGLRQTPPPGTRMYFYENIAPVGWTIQAITDSVLAVKGGAQAYNVAGGSQAGTWAQPNHTLVTAEVPAHTHNAIANHAHTIAAITGSGGASGISTGVDGSATAPSTSSAGGHTHTSVGLSGAHNHGTTYRPYAAVGIIASKG